MEEFEKHLLSPTPIRIEKDLEIKIFEPPKDIKISELYIKGIDPYED